MRSGVSVMRRMALVLLVALVLPTSALAADPTSAPIPGASMPAGPSAAPETAPPSVEPSAEPRSSLEPARPTPDPGSAAAPGLVEAVTPTSIVVTTSNTTVVPSWYRVVTATISPAPDGGTVEWTVNGELAQTNTLEPGEATAVLNFGYARTVGTYTVSAEFTGTAAFGASVSEAIVLTVVTQTIVLTSSADPAPVNTEVSLTATVTPNPGPGNVRFSFSGGEVTVALDANGTATLKRTFTTGGQFYFTADFLGNDDFPNLGDAMYQDVTWDAIVLDVTGASPQPAGPITATASVTPNPGGGTVRFRQGSWAAWSEPVAMESDGSVVLNLGTLNPSSYTFEFEYSGFGSYGPATDTLAIDVWLASTTTLTTNRTSAVKGELPVVLSATVAANYPPTGTVTFDDVVAGVHVTLGPVAITEWNPVATLSTSSLRAGTHTIRAIYSGVPGISGSTSAPITVVVANDTAVHGTYKADLGNFYPSTDGFRDTVKLGGILDERAVVTIRIYNSAGSLKRTYSLGWKNAGAYSTSWNGRTSTGAALPAGKYKTVAAFKDVRGNTRSIVAYTTLSWRKAAWKSATIVKYGDQFTYYVDTLGIGAIYYSPDHSRGRTLDSGAMDRDCAPSCGLAIGETTFALSTAGLGYRYLYVEAHGHGYVEREHTGMMLVEHPTTGALKSPVSLPEYEQAGVTYGQSVSPTYVSATKRLTMVLWMSQASGDAWDVHYLKLRYQYAVLL